MTRITGKFQITLPRRLVDAYGMRVGDEVDIVAAGEAIAIVPAGARRTVLSPEERLRHFDAATERQKARKRPRAGARKRDRGWSRDDLYDRGRPR
jgi:bifunctional DNA-binding transcriptional regulator/antitoxin component of YhaV-PrlF toxin-antitoxin module